MPSMLSHVGKKCIHGWVHDAHLECQTYPSFFNRMRKRLDKKQQSVLQRSAVNPNDFKVTYKGVECPIRDWSMTWDSHHNLPISVTEATIRFMIPVVPDPPKVDSKLVESQLDAILENNV